MLTISHQAGLGLVAPVAPTRRAVANFPRHAHLLCQAGSDDQSHLPWWRRITDIGKGAPAGTLILLRHGETEVPRGTSFIGCG